MAPHSSHREGQAMHTAGRKRKAPGDGVRDSAAKTTKSKHSAVAADDAGRPKGGERPLGAGAKRVAKGVAKSVARSVANGAKPIGNSKGKQKAKGKSAIDDIFAGVKQLKEEKAEEEVQRVAKKKKMKEEHKRRQANPFTGEGQPENRWAWADEVKPVRFDDDGLPIYTWDSLRMGQGGGTELCPFDCDCCF